MTRIVILGAGGHARVLVAALREMGSRAALACVAPEAPREEWPRDVEYLGDDAVLRGLDQKETKLVNGVGGIGSNARRRSMFENAKKAGFDFLTVVHPRSLISEDVILEEGAVVMMGAVLQTGCTIGINAIINTGAIIDHDGKIGAHVHVAPGATLSGAVYVAEGAHIGAGASVIQGVRIGREAVLAAGCVAVDDVPDGVTVFGAPARVR